MFDYVDNKEDMLKRMFENDYTVIKALGYTLPEDKNKDEQMKLTH
ncbi:hypothetical protein LC040_06950 [Bacillus tianshenii]|nr:hypothetical protein LC040_06950 [Bacillus tianshenii]